MDFLVKIFDSAFYFLFSLFQGFNILEVFDYLDRPFYVLFWIFFKNGGFLLFCGILMKCVYQYYQDAIIGKFFSKSKRIFLSVNIPKNNEQTPKSLEALFIQLAATNSPATFKEKYFDGKMLNETYSCEIVSLGGYIQFIISGPSTTKDLIESAIFAQYPDAEIMEVPDYASNFKNKYPDEEWDLWGTEIKMLGSTKPVYALPMKTYEDFIDENAEENSFKDPLSGILEFMSRMNKDENICIQILIRALDPVKTIPDFRTACTKLIRDMAGIKDVEKVKDKGIIYGIFKEFFLFIKDVIYTILFSHISERKDELKKEEKKDLTNWQTRLLPGDKLIVENIEKKISKPPLECKIRLMYVAKKTVFSKGKAFTGVLGTLQQYSNPAGMTLIPCKEVTVSANYFFVDKRKNMRKNTIIKGYVARSLTRGKEKFYLNTEELATLFHFPALNIKAPLITKVESKKVEPPMDLPMME